MARVIKRVAAKRDLTDHFVFLGDNASVDVARRFLHACFSFSSCSVRSSRQRGTGLLWRDRANPGAPTLSLAYPQTVHNPSSNRKTDTGLCRETTTTNVTGSRFIGEH